MKTTIRGLQAFIRELEIENDVFRKQANEHIDIIFNLKKELAAHRSGGAALARAMASQIEATKQLLNGVEL